MEQKENENENQNKLAYVPSDLIHEILFLLPQRYVAQYRTVCKSWNSEMCTTSFVYTHHARSLQSQSAQSPQPTSLLFFSSTTSDGRRARLCTMEDLDTDHVKVSKHPTHRTPFYLPSQLVGSANGLLCFRQSSSLDVGYVCNPLTGQYLQLPPGPRDGPFRGYAIAGFGFDPVEKVYKVLTMTKNGRRKSSGVQVLTISADGVVVGSYRNVNVSLSQKRIITRRSPGVAVSGRLHWFGDRKPLSSPTAIIYSFDLHDEQFRTMIYTRQNSRPRPNPRLGELEGFLTVYEDLENGTVMSAMKEYGNSSSWKKEPRLPAMLVTPTAVCKWKEGLVLVMACGRLFSYNTVKREVMYNVMEDLGFTATLPFVGGLVPLCNKIEDWRSEGSIEDRMLAICRLMNGSPNKKQRLSY